ncbi:hypothetical protein TNCT_674241 [Trichonephila clavata]|uniref:Uncharacterized protein n=1 Tax=Trichonephila clavata TaxID=2740835 RepID=A0A8X6IM27_TRICU|nr:hypothetical protein TNCT_674241 [Trichonephila clavata]
MFYPTVFPPVFQTIAIRNQDHRRYPDNGAATTRKLLVFLIVYTCYATLSLSVSLLYNEEILLYIASLLCGVSSALLAKVLARILRFYLYRRSLEKSGVPIDPNETLSFANYMRILLFRSPEGY